MSVKKIPIVFAFDERVLRPAAVAIRSLIEAANADTSYQIHILHPGFSKKIIEGFSVIARSSNHIVIFHQVDNSQFAGLPSGRGSWTEIVYYRFLIPEILTECDRAIYSDIDVYFKGDLSSLMKLEMGEAPIGAVVGEVNSPEMKCHTYFPENNSKYIFMSGFLLLELNLMRKGTFTKKLLNTAKAYGYKLKMYDLDALNLACCNILPLPFEYCVLETIFESPSVDKAAEYHWLSEYYSISDLERAKANPKIIHYAGPLGKPWRRANQPNYYKEALKLVPKALNRKTLRDVRKYWTNWLAAILQKKVTP